MTPFKNIETQNLRMLLVVARVFVYLGMVFLAISVIFALMALTQNIMTAAMAFSSIPIALVLLFLAGVAAAVVSIEENVRKRTEYVLDTQNE